MAVWATKVALTVSGGRVNPFVRVLILLALSLWPAQVHGRVAPLAFAVCWHGRDRLVVLKFGVRKGLHYT